MTEAWISEEDDCAVLSQLPSLPVRSKKNFDQKNQLAIFCGQYFDFSVEPRLYSDAVICIIDYSRIWLLDYQCHAVTTPLANQVGGRFVLSKSI